MPITLDMSDMSVRQWSAMNAPKDAITAQLAEQLAAQIRNWEAIAGQVAAIHLKIAVDASLPYLAASLTDGTAALGTADAIVGVLFAGRPPEHWWLTPAGCACARLLAPHATGTITYRSAAQMLGLAKRTIETLVQRGHLERDPAGDGLLLASVLARIGQRDLNAAKWPSPGQPAGD